MVDCLVFESTGTHEVVSPPGALDILPHVIYCRTCYFAPEACYVEAPEEPGILDRWQGKGPDAVTNDGVGPPAPLRVMGQVLQCDFPIPKFTNN